MKQFNIQNIVRNFIGAVSTVETADKLAQEVYQKILSRDDIESEEYKELVRHYHSLRRLYKKLYNEKLEQESSFKIIALN